MGFQEHLTLSLNMRRSRLDLKGKRDLEVEKEIPTRTRLGNFNDKKRRKQPDNESENREFHYCHVMCILAIMEFSDMEFGIICRLYLETGQRLY